MIHAYDLPSHTQFKPRAVCVVHDDLVVYQTAKKQEDWYCRQWHYPQQTSCIIKTLFLEVPE